MPLFRGLSKGHLLPVLQNAKRIELDAGATAIEEGSVGRDLYVVVSGLMEVCRIKPGDCVSITTLGPGEIFGEIALLEAHTRTATVRATQPSVLLRLNPAILQEDPNSALLLYRNLAAILARRLKMTSTAYYDLTLKLVRPG